MAGLEKNPNLGGKISVAVTACPSGEVVKARGSGSVGAPQVDGCIVSVLEHARLPESRCGFSTVVPVAFGP